MITFLFWNTNKKDVRELIASLATTHQVDVIILAECGTPSSALLTIVNERSNGEYHLPDSVCSAITIITRFSRNFLTPKFETDRLSFRLLHLPARPELLISVVHLPSKLFSSEDSQVFGATELARRIAETESEIGHRRTIIVGDFNMNPFEKGIIAASGLHAVMSRRIAARGSRTVQGKKYHFFFNPMWAHLGDQMDSPPGTYYYERAEPVNYFWNAFDQVLLRPDLIDFFPLNGLQILTAVGDDSLITDKGIPDRNHASDHLPIIFRLDL